MVLIRAHVMLTGALVRPDVNAAVLGAERKHFESILEARQLGGQGDIERISIDGIDLVPSIPAHQERAAVDQTGHPIVVALDQRPSHSGFTQHMVGLIRFGGHVPKGGYDVPYAQYFLEPAVATAIHG